MSAGATLWKAVKAHVPLIKFRSGTARPHTPTLVESTSPPGPKVGLSPRGTGIEENLLPKKYQRKPFSSLEMEVIERGGPDKF